ncbi:hypothetical protein K788_0002499 [Paraburkholderia caribensis MBA4]|uniref:TagK domain-containing protein n=1 Tax=Paraburkholderia caribensis MBA4 TaxID=1323664 RepID=A0A0P0R9G3_9BURK|nr:TagK domain-containing protein [Paraburkholderia caribensis]ALL64996.1 hypothetical protein K788_0002499 [Paraburkholderia caribensis MBA4]
MNGQRAPFARDAADEPGFGASVEGAEGASSDAIREGRFPRDSSLDNIAIFGVLGVSSNAVREASVRERSQSSGHVDRDDLLASLQNQYYQALESPHALPHAPWASSSLPLAEHAWTLTSAGDARCDDISAPIGDFLSDIQKLEEAFGPLRRGVSDVGQPEEIPEILRLFAPPEYHASVACRAAAIPPTVARRDHHTLAIDSPLAALGHHSNRTDPEYNR